ncbi:MAG: pectate lyase [Thermoguttaceae bacterium]
MRLVAVFSALAPVIGRADETRLQQEAAEALRKATRFFVERVSTEGGYLWRYSEDLSRREGEGKATAWMVWVQPPGTPAVGMALLEAYRATGERPYLEAARRAGYCLVRGQLRSGGWDYRIEFDSARRKRYAYRVEPAPAEPRKAGQANTSTLDDNTTQAALRLLIRLDQCLEFKDAPIHEAARYGLGCLLAVQYPNGAWPQRFEGPADPAKHPVKKASYPESWSRSWTRPSYASYYTLNDNAISDTIEVMFEAAEVYGDARYRKSAERAGDFLLAAQMPEPQPAWAQQYDPLMHPAWARKFEPPAITGGESQEVLRTLLAIYRQTGDRKYLEPVEPALAYLRRSQLPDGRLARFYELKTNRPLYFTRDYELTYSDADTPTHYAFKVSNRLEAIQQEYRELLAADRATLRPRSAQRPRPTARPSPKLIAQVKAVIAALDEQGRWVEQGRLRHHGPDDPTRRVIDSQTFIRNVGILSAFLASIGPRA